MTKELDLSTERAAEITADYNVGVNNGGATVNVAIGRPKKYDTSLSISMIEIGARALADARNIPPNVTAEQRRNGHIARTDVFFSPTEWDRIAVEMVLRAILKKEFI